MKNFHGLFELWYNHEKEPQEIMCAVSLPPPLSVSATSFQEAIKWLNVIITHNLIIIVDNSFDIEKARHLDPLVKTVR